MPNRSIDKFFMARHTGSNETAITVSFLNSSTFARPAVPGGIFYA